jgi:hypothetical protein
MGIYGIIWHCVWCRTKGFDTKSDVRQHAPDSIRIWKFDFGGFKGL